MCPLSLMRGEITMKFYGDANLQQNYIKEAVVPVDATFPVSPVVGQFVFKDSVLYICLSVTNGTPVWCPLTKEITTYTHTQSSASSTWNITHNLNSRSVSITVFDSNDRVIIPNEIEVTGIGTATISLASAIAGKAVVLTGHSDGNTPPVYSYEFRQTDPSTTWVINHDLGRNPIVRVFIGNQEVQPASITFTTANTVTVTFSSVQVGYAKLI